MGYYWPNSLSNQGATIYYKEKRKYYQKKMRVLSLLMVSEYGLAISDYQCTVNKMAIDTTYCKFLMTLPTMARHAVGFGLQPGTAVLLC